MPYDFWMELLGSFRKFVRSLTTALSRSAVLRISEVPCTWLGMLTKVVLIRKGVCIEPKSCRHTELRGRWMPWAVDHERTYRPCREEDLSVQSKLWPTPGLDDRPSARLRKPMPLHGHALTSRHCRVFYQKLFMSTDAPLLAKMLDALDSLNSKLNTNAT